MSARPEPVTYGDRAVFTVSDFNQGVAGWLARLGNVWVEGELSELAPRARIVFFCLKDERDGSVLQGWMDRDRFERLEPAPADGDRLHAYGRGELWRKRGEFRFRAFTLEQFGLGQLLKRIEELRAKLGAEGLFAEERKRPLPLLPRVVGLVCGTDAAAKRDVIETAERRYPPVRFRIVEATVQGAGRVRIDRSGARKARCRRRGGRDRAGPRRRQPRGSPPVLRRGRLPGGRRVLDAGGLRDRPRAGQPARRPRGRRPRRDAQPGSAYGRARPRRPPGVARRAPDARSARARGRGGAGPPHARAARRRVRPSRGPQAWIDVRRAALAASGDRLARGPALRLERESARVAAAHGRLRVLGPAATLERGYAIVQDEAGAVVRESGAVSVDDRVGVRLARGRLVARVEETAE